MSRASFFWVFRISAALLLAVWLVEESRDDGMEGAVETFEQPALEGEDSSNESRAGRPELLEELKKVQDKLASESLSRFSRETELASLDNQQRADDEREARILEELNWEPAEQAALRLERDAATQEALEAQRGMDISFENQRIFLERELEVAQLRADEVDRQARVARDQVRLLESFNFETDELVAAREKTRALSDSAEALALQRDQIRLEIRTLTQAVDERRRWDLEQRRFETQSALDARLREQERKYGALRMELSEIERNSDVRSARVEELEASLRRSASELNELESVRTRILEKLQESPKDEILTRQPRPS